MDIEKQFYSLEDAFNAINRYGSNLTKNDLLMKAAQGYLPIYIFHSGFIGLMFNLDYMIRENQFEKRIPFSGILQIKGFHDYGSAINQGEIFVSGVTPIEWFRHKEKKQRFDNECEKLGADYQVFRASFENEIIHDNIPIADFLISANDVEKLIKNPGSKKSESTRKTENLLRAIACIAVDAYGYDPLSSKSNTPKDIADAMSRYGHSVDQKTVRGWLKEGADLLPVNPQKD